MVKKYGYWTGVSGIQGSFQFLSVLPPYQISFPALVETQPGKRTRWHHMSGLS